MAVLLDQERERYLAYECKRLNVVSNGKKSSLATPYVADGLSRFISEQYAEKLPVGCMLGYVLDGDLSGAQSKIYAAINTKKSHIGLKASPVQDQPVGAARRFFSHHLRPANGHEIEIRHALLPFPKISAAKAKPPKHVSPGSPMAVSE
jgi:hypothetical protein